MKLFSKSPTGLGTCGGVHCRGAGLQSKVQWHTHAPLIQNSGTAHTRTSDPDFRKVTLESGLCDSHGSSWPLDEVLHKMDKESPQLQAIRQDTAVVVSEGCAETVEYIGAFLNVEGRHQRDLTIACLGAYAKTISAAPSTLNFVDALSASGLRALRIALEIPECKVVLANDILDSAVACLERNIARSANALLTANAEIQSSCLEASLFMETLRARRMQIHGIDLDPFGSPIEQIPSALRCVVNGGVLSAAFFDVHVLCGQGHGASAACFARYGAMPLRHRCAEETALRIALGCISRLAGQQGRHIEPLLCAYMEACIRIVVRVWDNSEKPSATPNRETQNAESPGRAAGPEAEPSDPEMTLQDDFAGARAPRCAATKPGALGVVWQCCRCPFFRIQPVGRAEEESGGGACPEGCGDRCLELGGPLWIGELCCPAFVARCEEEVAANRRAGRVGRGSRLEEVLREVKGELGGAPLFHTVAGVAAAGGFRAPARERVARKLRERGFRVSGGHVAVALALKTDAPWREVVGAVRQSAGLAREAGGGVARKGKRQRGEVHGGEASADVGGEEEGARPKMQRGAAEMRAEHEAVGGRGGATVGEGEASQGGGAGGVCHQGVAEEAASAGAGGGQGGAGRGLSRRERRRLKFGGQRGGVEGGEGQGAASQGEGAGSCEGEATHCEAATSEAQAWSVGEGGRRVWRVAVGVEGRGLREAMAAAGEGDRVEVAGGAHELAGPLRVAARLEVRGQPGAVLRAATAPAVLVKGGGELTLEGVTVEAGGKHGRAALEVMGGRATLQGCTVRGGRGVRSVAVFHGGHLRMGGCGLEGEEGGARRGGGLLAAGKARAEVWESRVRGSEGPGVEVRGGARVRLQGCEVEGSGKSGVFCHGGGEAELVGCRVARCEYAGVECSGSGCGRVRGGAVEGCGRGGVFVHSQGRAELRCCAVRGSRLAGVHVKWGGQALAEEVEVSEGGQSGLLVEDEGSRLDVTQCTIRGNRRADVSVFAGGLLVLRDMDSVVAGRSGEEALQAMRCVAPGAIKAPCPPFSSSPPPSPMHWLAAPSEV